MMLLATLPAESPLPRDGTHDRLVAFRSGAAHGG